MSEDKYTRITLRIPTALNKELDSLAIKKSTSKNAQIIEILEEGLIINKSIDTPTSKHEFKMNCISAMKTTLRALEMVEKLKDDEK